MHVRPCENRNISVWVAQLAGAVKQTNCFSAEGEVPVMLDLWGMRSKPSVPSLPCPFWPVQVALDGVLSMGQIEQNCVLKLNCIVWNKTVSDIETAYLCLTELFERDLFSNTTKPCTYTKLNFFFKRTVLTFNLTVLTFNLTVLTFNLTVLTFNFVNKNHTYTKLNCLKFNSALNDPKRGDTL